MESELIVPLSQTEIRGGHADKAYCMSRKKVLFYSRGYLHDSVKRSRKGWIGVCLARGVSGPGNAPTYAEGVCEGATADTGVVMSSGGDVTRRCGILEHTLRGHLRHGENKLSSMSGPGMQTCTLKSQDSEQVVVCHIAGIGHHDVRDVERSVFNALGWL